MSRLEALRRALAPIGLNAWGVVSAARYDAAAPPHLRSARVHPGTRSIVVAGSGGRAHFAALEAHVAEDPVARLAREPHPLDAFCARKVAAQAALTEGCRVVFPTFRAEPRLDFVRLAELAGLGRPGELGILLSPTFGPWFALRLALFTPDALDETPPAARACEGCAAPCRGAASFAAARLACVAAPEHAYTPLQRLYHDDRRAGRAALCARFGVADEHPDAP